MKTSTVLRRAAHVVLERGIAKGAFACYGTGAVCAVGAIRVAESNDPDLMSDTEDAVGWCNGRGIGEFNDRYSTTAEDVASLLYSEAEVFE